jgi:hypothetical protein
MTVFAYNTPHVASPINDRRGGTYRVGSDSPDPIQITKGWDAILYFAFRSHTQKVYDVTGQTVTGRLYNTENVEVWNGVFIADLLVKGAAQLKINSNATQSFSAGFHSLTIEYVDRGKSYLVQTTRSLPRFVIEVLDTTTVSINN